MSNPARRLSSPAAPPYLVFDPPPEFWSSLDVAPMHGAPRAALLQVINDYLAAAQTEKSPSTISAAKQRALRVSEAAQL
jgi:hypothetical protein